MIPSGTRPPFVQRGVSCSLSKAMHAQDIVSTLRLVHLGEPDIQSRAREVPAATSKEEADGRPTDSGLAVLRLLAEGCHNPEIARQLGASEGVVQYRLRQLLARVQATSRSELVQRARGKGWLA